MARLVFHSQHAHSLFLSSDILNRSSHYYNCLCPNVFRTLWSPLDLEPSPSSISRLDLSLVQSHAHSRHSVVFGSVGFSPCWKIHLFSSFPLFFVWAKGPRVSKARVSLTLSSLSLWTCADISHLMQSGIYLSLLPMWNLPSTGFILRTVWEETTSQATLWKSSSLSTWKSKPLLSSDCSDPWPPGGAVDQVAHPVPVVG